MSPYRIPSPPDAEDIIPFREPEIQYKPRRRPLDPEVKFCINLGVLVTLVLFIVTACHCGQ